MIVPSLGILGARGARGARTFSRLYTRARSRIMRARETKKKWVQNFQTLTDWYGLRIMVRKDAKARSFSLSVFVSLRTLHER